MAIGKFTDGNYIPDDPDGIRYRIDGEDVFDQNNQMIGTLIRTSGSDSYMVISGVLNDTCSLVLSPDDCN